MFPNSYSDLAPRFIIFQQRKLPPRIPRFQLLPLAMSTLLDVVNKQPPAPTMSIDFDAPCKEAQRRLFCASLQPISITYAIFIGMRGDLWMRRFSMLLLRMQPV